MNMPASNQFSPIARTIIVGGSLFLIIIGLHQISSFVNTAFLAIVICITTTPLVNWFKRKGMSKGLSVGITALLLVGSFIGVMALILRSGEQLIQYLPEISTTSTERVADVSAALKSNNIDTTNLASFIEKLLNAGFTGVSNILSTLSSWMAILALAVLASIFMLSESTSFSNRLSNRFDSSTRVWANLNRFVVSTRHFFIVATIMGIIQGTIIAIALYIIGVPFPVTWGLLFWLLNYIPYIGIWLSVIPPMLIAGMEYGPQYALLVLIIYAVVRNVFNLIIYPKVMGDKVDISVTVGFLGLFFWGWTLGAFGALLAYPYTLLVRDVFLNSTTDDIWLVEIMKSSTTPEKKVTAESELINEQ